MRRGALVLSALLLLATGPAAAQERELGSTLERFAASWARGDAAGVAAFSARAGVSLDLKQEGPSGPLAPRQVAALLRRFFDGRETVRVQLGMMRVMKESPAHGFGELRWTSRAQGTTQPERAIVFIGWVREDDGWRLTQIRVLP